MSQKKHKILMVYVEPTPYILGLINIIVPFCKGQVDILFLEENLTQNWNISENKQWLMLPKNIKKKIQFIVKLLLNNKYDLIHIAGWGLPICLFIIFIAKMFRIPITVETDTPLPHKIKFWKRAIKRVFYPSLFKLVNLFLPGGTRQAKYLKYYAVADENIVSVQMTVDVTYIKQYVKLLTSTSRQSIRERFNIPETDIVFLFVGRLEKFKGIEELLAVFRIMKHKHVTLLVVGDGNMRQQIIDVMKENNKILYAGRLSGDELIEIYFATDVLVLPSHFEPWGLVINEAMAVGRPVIVSDRVGCIDDLVINQKTGLIIKAESINELQTAIEILVSDSGKRIEMGNQAAKIISEWTLENEAKKICQAWFGLIQLETDFH